jgi:serine/threonine-protein kinase HipA
MYQRTANPLSCSCFIGTRGMGALEFEPSHCKQKAFDIEIDNLISLSQKMLSKRADFKTNWNEKDQNAMLTFCTWWLVALVQKQLLPTMNKQDK